MVCNHFTLENKQFKEIFKMKMTLIPKMSVCKLLKSQLYEKHNTKDQNICSTKAKTLSASRLLLISAPSRRVCRSALDVSAPLSFPARSIRENFPCIFPRRRRMIWKTAWLREEWALADVCPDVLQEAWWGVFRGFIQRFSNSNLVTV